MNEDQTKLVANATETQTKAASSNTGILNKSEQKNVANSESVANQEQNQNLQGQNVKENATTETPQEKPADSSTDKSQATDQDQPTTDDPVKNSDNPTAESPKNLSDVVPSTIVWLSGMVGKKQYDCAGPFSVPFKIDKPTWPYVNIAPNPKYTNQVFDYDADGGAGAWVPTDAKSQGQLLTDLTKQVTALKDDSQKHDQSADQSQKMGMQLTKVMLQLSSKVDALNTKIDGIVNNEKDGDK